MDTMILGLKIFYSHSIRGSIWNINDGCWCDWHAYKAIQWWRGTLILPHWCINGWGFHIYYIWLTMGRLILLFCAETVLLATKYECIVPALWLQLSPMVTILNCKGLLDSFQQNVVARIQKIYFMLTSNLDGVIPS